ncbi:MAG: leucine-rich repeat domain-containing protein [Eubacterium sp.]
MKKIISVFMMLCLLTGIISVSNLVTYAASNDNYNYLVKNSEVTITKYIGSEKDVVIPETIDGLPVVAINQSAFYSSQITSVVMPDTLKTIGKDAFQFCNSLASVKFGNSVESIGDYAFYECIKIKELVLPNSLKTIGVDALVCSSSLKYLFIPSGVTSIGKEGVGFKRLFVYENENDPFTKAIDGFVIYGYSGGAAEEYALANSFKFVDVSDAFNTAANGVTLRTTKPGMRFGFQLNSVDAPTFDKLYELELGFLYTYTGDSSNLTIDNAGKNGVYKKVASNSVINESNISYNLVFTNIPKTEYNTKISACAYAIVNGEIYYSQAKTYCLNDVLNLVLEDDGIDQNTKDSIKSNFL